MNKSLGGAELLRIQVRHSGYHQKIRLHSTKL
jgi:hypothetical protein